MSGTDILEGQTHKAGVPIWLVGMALMAGLLQACVHHEPRKIDGFWPRGTAIIGHRGAKGVAPENTMAAFKNAADLGVPFELDTMLSADGQPVVIHDYTVDRTTRGKGKVASLSVKELQALDAGSVFSDQFKAERIPTLEAVLLAFAPKVLVDIEIKYEGPKEKAADTVRAVIGVIERTGSDKRVFITAFNPYILAEFVKLRPDLIRGQLYGTFDDAKIPFYQKVILRNLLLNDKSDPDLLAVEDKLVDQDYVTRYHELGYKIAVWTVNDPKRIQELLGFGVDGIITDFPQRALRLAREAGRAP